MIRILHTSDWHLGKKIHRVDLAPDHRLFADWLCAAVERHGVDAVVVAGDVFDTANPAADARALYYDILLRLRNLGCQVVVVGGNHDSPPMLDAPRDLLKALEITVVGRVSVDDEPPLVLLSTRGGAPEAVVAAVPFLREGDLGVGRAFEGRDERLAAARAALVGYYRRAGETARCRFPGLPLVATGHFFGVGAAVSEAERDLAVGNLDLVEVGQLAASFDFMALGHIHRPQRLSAPVPALYSGAPLALSFSEFDDKKRVVLVDIAPAGETMPTLLAAPQVADINTDIDTVTEAVLECGAAMRVASLPVPAFRRLVRVKGAFEQVVADCEAVTTPDGALPTLVEAEIVTDEYSPLLNQQAQQWIDGWERDDALVVKHRVTCTRAAAAADPDEMPDAHIDDFTPTQIFESLMDHRGVAAEDRALALEAFRELLDERENSVGAAAL